MTHLKAGLVWSKLACSLVFEELMPGKSIIISSYRAKCSGILPRVNMPHFHYLIMSLDFYPTCRCAQYNLS